MDVSANICVTQRKDKIIWFGMSSNLYQRNSCLPFKPSVKGHKKNFSIDLQSICNIQSAIPLHFSIGFCAKWRKSSLHQFCANREWQLVSRFSQWRDHWSMCLYAMYIIDILHNGLNIPLTQLALNTNSTSGKELTIF